MLAAEGLGASTWQIARTIMNELGIPPALYGYSSDMGLHNAIWAPVKQAQAARDAGRALDANPTTPIRVPRIPTIPASKPDFEYRVAIVVKSPHGVRESTALNIYSPYQLTREQIEERAIEVAMNRLQQEGDTPGAQRVANLIPVSTVTVHTVSVGRR